MNIKTLISLKQKMDNIKSSFNKKSIYEVVIEKFIFFSFLVSLLALSLLFTFFIKKGFIISLIFTFVGSLIYAFFSILGYFSFHKLFEKDKSEIYKIISNRFSENLKFNRSELIENFIKELTEEETLLLKEISEIKNVDESHFDIFNQQVLKYAKNANKEELDFILNSIKNKELRYQILEISQNKVEEKLHINQQTVIKNI